MYSCGMNKPGPKTPAPVVKRTYTVDEETHKFLIAAGAGNASRGLRAAAWLWYVCDQRGIMPLEVTRRNDL